MTRLNLLDLGCAASPCGSAGKGGAGSAGKVDLTSRVGEDGFLCNRDVAGDASDCQADADGGSLGKGMSSGGSSGEGKGESKRSVSASSGVLSGELSANEERSGQLALVNGSIPSHAAVARRTTTLATTRGDKDRRAHSPRSKSMKAVEEEGLTVEAALQAMLPEIAGGGGHEELGSIGCTAEDEARASRRRSIRASCDGGEMMSTCNQVAMAARDTRGPRFRRRTLTTPRSRRWKRDPGLWAMRDGVIAEPCVAGFVVQADVQSSAKPRFRPSPRAVTSAIIALRSASSIFALVPFFADPLSGLVPLGVPASDQTRDVRSSTGVEEKVGRLFVLRRRSTV
jgi:hypothetical protein